MTATTQAEAGALTLEMESPDAARAVPVVQPVGTLALAENSPAAMFMRAMERGATAEQIGQMMDLQDRWEGREAEKAYNAAFAAFKAEAVEIIKRKRVHFPNNKGGFTDYKHAELSDVVEAATPALSKYGLSTSWKVTKQEPAWIEVTCFLKHEKGHFETATLGGPPDQSGGKNAIQAISSAKTYLERQTMKAVCGLAEKGADDDGNGGLAAPEAQQPGAGSPLDGLSDSGWAAARQGMTKLTAWWKTLGGKDQAAMSKAFGEMRKEARKVDDGARQ